MYIYMYIYIYIYAEEITQIAISNTHGKAQLYFVFKMYRCFSCDNTPCLADRVQSNYPRSAKSCSYLFLCVRWSLG